MSLRRKFTYLLPWVRRAEDRDIREELESLREVAGPGALGNLTLAEEDARAALSWTWLERLAQDLRYAFRSMRHHKGFTALVVVSLALGIGANTAIYSFMDGILLRPLPVRDPHSLVIMKWRAKSYSLATSGMMWSTGGSTFDKDTNTTISSIFPYAAVDVFRATDVVSNVFYYVSANRLSLTTGDETESVKGLHVSGEYFTGMGVDPIAGRLIQPADDVLGSAGVAVLSQRYSQRHFGTPGAAVGRTIRINDKPFQVIGVAPSTFFGAEPGAIPDVFMPMRADSILETAPGGAQRYTDDHLYWLEIMARLKPGVTLPEAQTALGQRFAQFATQSAAALAAAKAPDGSIRATADRLNDLPVLSLQSGATGLDSLRRQYARPIYILMVMVGLILLIACSNVASLLLSRASARRREIAVRLSIGASRGRVIRQLLTESVLLASIGGALGILVAAWGMRVLTSLLSNGRENFTLHAELNWTVLMVTLALSVATGLLFGLAPALQATRVDIVPALKDIRATAATRRKFGIGMSTALVVAQLVLSLVLLVGAGLFGRTLTKLHSIQLGFDRENVLLFTIRPAAIGVKGDSLLSLYDNVRHELMRQPGVRTVSLSSGALPMGGGTMAPAGIAGAMPLVPLTDLPPAFQARGFTRAAIATVGPAFFETMKIPLMGREFGDADVAGRPPVAIVNRRFAKAFDLDAPVGRMLSMTTGDLEIIGVADDALIFDLKEELRPIVYLPYMQAARPPGGMVFEVRTSGDPMGLAGAARQTVRRIDPRIALYDVKSQAAHVDQAISSEITLARLCTVFAALALAIACVGLYGTVAFSVARRTSEIGIRMTLGAARIRILWMVLRSVLVMTAAGLAIGLPLAIIGSRYVRSLLFGIEPSDSASLAIGAGALLVCALLAGFIPARRAARIDPMLAVRTE